MEAKYLHFYIELMQMGLFLVKDLEASNFLLLQVWKVHALLVIF